MKTSDVWEVATKIGERTKIEIPYDVALTATERDKIHKAAIRSVVSILEEEGLVLVESKVLNTPHNKLS